MERASAVEAQQGQQARAMQNMAVALEAKFTTWETELLETQALLHASCDSLFADESGPFSPSVAAGAMASPMGGGGRASGASAGDHGWMICDSPYQATQSILAQNEEAIDLTRRYGSNSGCRHVAHEHSMASVNHAWPSKDGNHASRGSIHLETTSASGFKTWGASGLVEGYDGTSLLSPVSSTHANPQE